MKIVDQESVNTFIHHLPDLFVVSLIIVLSSHDKNAQLQYLTFFYLIKMPLPAITFMMITELILKGCPVVQSLI